MLSNASQCSFSVGASQSSKLTRLYQFNNRFSKAKQFSIHLFVSPHFLFLDFYFLIWTDFDFDCADSVQFFFCFLRKRVDEITKRKLVLNTIQLNHSFRFLYLILSTFFFSLLLVTTFNHPIFVLLPLHTLDWCSIHFTAFQILTFRFLSFYPFKCKVLLQFRFSWPFLKTIL